jgi:hypothetical protein
LFGELFQANTELHWSHSLVLVVQSRLGAKTIGRWHAPGSIIGWHLIEGDLAAVAQHVAEWADLLECEVYPVMEDAEAATAVNKVLGK